MTPKRLTWRQWFLNQVMLMLRPNPGWYGLLAALALTMLGVSAIATVDEGYAALQFERQLPIALVAMLLCMLPHPRAIGHFAYPLMVLSLAMLVFLILPGVPRSIVPIRNGAKAWVNLGVMMFQPSEMAKIAFVLALAWYLRYRDSYRTFIGLLIPFVLMFIPVGLILKEPDLGQALLFAPTLFAMLVAAGAKLRHLGSLVGLAGLAVGLTVAITLWAPDSMQFLKPHQQMRIRSMISLAQGDSRYLAGAAYQQHKAMTLISAGGVAGYGEERARDIIEFNRLPFDHNDMIFAVIANRWGMLGAWALLGLYFVLILSFLLTAGKSKDPFARLSCVGFAGMILTQVVINVGMNIGLLPITGITLPFISYGGSSLLAMFCMVGLVLNFASRRPSLLARPSFEFDNADAVFQ